MTNVWRVILASLLILTMFFADAVASTDEAGAYCYNGTSNHASLNWEYNGSDARLWWNADVSVAAVRNTSYSVPTTAEADVWFNGSKTTYLAGWGARSAGYSWPAQALPTGRRYGAIYSTWDGYARRLRSDLNACT